MNPGDHVTDPYREDLPEPPDTSPRERVFILPPELSDGFNPCIVRQGEIGSIVADALREWIEEATEGEELVIGWREMSAQQIERLPDL